MWKPGQLVTLWGKLYQIKKCSYSYNYQACMFCQQTNKRPPCIDGFDYPDKRGFDLRECRLKVPEGCIPKRVKPNSSGKSTMCN